MWGGGGEMAIFFVVLNKGIESMHPCTYCTYPKIVHGGGGGMLHRELIVNTCFECHARVSDMLGKGGASLSLLVA